MSLPAPSRTSTSVKMAVRPALTTLPSPISSPERAAERKLTCRSLVEWGRELLASGPRWERTAPPATESIRLEMTPPWTTSFALR